MGINFDPVAFVAAKRRGETHTADELRAWADGVVSGTVQSHQVSAWLMAVCFQGMEVSERFEWTKRMLESGEVLKKPTGSENTVWIDKHSTGGVGDKTSLILAPLVASCLERLCGKGAVQIPMFSGRGLGLTGGTLDKLDSIPGFRSTLPKSDLMQVLCSEGFFVVGADENFAPADRLIYAIRDVTATVDCVPLIVSSILSKKLAAGLDSLVLDVKAGLGSFMPTEAEARNLAEALCATAGACGLPTLAVITRMDQPLGWAVGNRHEVVESIEFLSGQNVEPGLFEVVSVLGAAMIQRGTRKQLSFPDARGELERELHSGRALAAWHRWVLAQGGDDRGELFRPEAKCPAGYVDIAVKNPSAKPGWVFGIDARKVAVGLTRLGGGRLFSDQTIDADVGFRFRKKVGDALEPGETWVTVRVREKSADGARIAEDLNQAISVSERRVTPPSWILGVIGDESSQEGKQ